MGLGLVDAGTHVAGGARGSGGVVDAGDPLIRIQVHLVDLGAVDDAVLGFVVDLDLGMVGTDVAFTTGVRGTSLFAGEAVTAVASGAGALGAVGIQPANTRIGPATRQGTPFVLAFGDEFQLAAMALTTASVDCGGSAHHFAHEVIQGGKDVTGLGVMGAVHLLEFGGVALGAILGGDDDGDQRPLVIEGINLAFLRLVAVQAVDPVLAMLAVVPLPIEARILRHVAIDAFLTGGIPPVDTDFTGRAIGLGWTIGQ